MNNNALKMINRIYKPLLIIAFTCILTDLQAQNQVVAKLGLEDAITIAQTQSPDALIAKHRFRSSYWEFRSFKAQFMPKLNLDATLPEFNRSISTYTLPNGQETYVKQNFTSYSSSLSLSKVIGYTGGSIYARSSLQRLDNNQDSTTNTSYLSNPITIGYQQPIFAFNQYYWDHKIDPIKYEEAKQRYLEDNEQIALTASNYFFNLLIAQIQKKTSEINEANYDTLYQIAKGRYNMGTIAENELLQLELNLLKSQSDLENALLEVENAMFRLKSFLRLKGTEKIDLTAPDEAYFFDIPIGEATEQAHKNRSSALAFDRRLLEAQMNVNQAKRDNRFSANLSVEYGLNGNAETIPDVYKNPDDNQQLSLGIHVPILDWGQAKGRIKMAESNAELVKTSVEQEKLDFDQEIFLAVMQFNMQKNQLKIAAKSDTVANKSFQVAKARYMIGRISITDLNIAQSEKDQARSGYIRALQRYWVNYFNLRKLTLYDFRQKRNITADLNKLM
jgi:outer membrane protein TolC